MARVILLVGGWPEGSCKWIQEKFWTFEIVSDLNNLHSCSAD